ncbi:molecular chaperone HtpG [Candidatus Erwinia haradaeae]|uniref:Chaperone protein HtpG n=1 Tax=Candidatus Erwinia haradaeae TaxID=1922217 RepID=A0A451D9M8_9GAMM|nr:molecular chaperone HtpG [Candidatus Erwinia haradaeae]VFP82893.1 Chaperone protein HtpG [Candidatus Erwinia haradaeae]
MKGQETLHFQSEVKELLKLMIHSLYSNKEIFLRELISNASDAAEKLRFQALSTSNMDHGNLCVRISIDKECRTLMISDNGIGMTRDEVIDNLGTIARSGTKSFISSLGSDQAKNSQLIGQFGVGFYSAFIVSDKVEVRTRSVTSPDNSGVSWQSSGEGEYTITDIEKDQRGTEIILHLRDDEDVFLDPWHIRSIVSKYSEHLSLPVEIQTYNEKDDTTSWEQINKAQALWTRNKSDITEDEYKEFYKHLSHDQSDPLTWSHNRVEGKQEYTSLLYVPTQAPWDMWNREHKHGLKLYVQRVFIMDDAEQFLPNYLRFIKGVIDSNNLPLNISREILQTNHITQTLRVALIKRSLQMLETVAKNDPEKYKTFWKQFGRVLKEGPAEDRGNINTIINLLRFSSTVCQDALQTVSLVDYTQRMKENQEKIYYITADSYLAAKNSPYLEMFHKKSIEVLLLSDRIDEWMMSHITEFEGKKFQSVSTADTTLNQLADTTAEIQKQTEQALEPFVHRVKALLGTRVKDVNLTHRLCDTPAIVTTDVNDMSTQMAKLFSATGQEVPEINYLFEINPDHVLVKRAADTKDDAEFADWIELFLSEALFAATGTLENPHQFIQRLNRMLLQSHIENPSISSS